MKIRNAYYIKLGEGGSWEVDSLRNGRLRIGWRESDLHCINSGSWEEVERQIRAAQLHRGTATRDFNALKSIVASNAEDIWITFSASSLWWCRLADGGIEEDHTSKFRRTLGQWVDVDVKGRRLLLSEIPGGISKLQGFRGTVCMVKPVERLCRLLDGQFSPAFSAVSTALACLATDVSSAIKELHWKDFETLVDLIFRDAGWRRVSVLGETMKYADLELEEPITQERYQVQIKSTADAAEFAAYRDRFSGRGFRKLFFVVHSPKPDLSATLSEESAELILPDRLGRMIVDAGLVGWVLQKIR